MVLSLSVQIHIWNYYVSTVDTNYSCETDSTLISIFLPADRGSLGIIGECSVWREGPP